jgi:lipopolysaccharide cholinephosphotransferase
MGYLLTQDNDGVEYYAIPHLKDVQLRLLNLLKIIDEIARENNIDYWIDGGTLLGAVRHGGFIPWDDDLDICLLKKDYDKLIPLLKKYIEQKAPELGLMYDDAQLPFWAEYFYDKSIIGIHDGIKSNLHIDILPIKLVKDNKTEIELDTCISDIAGFFIYGKVKYYQEIKTKFKFKSFADADSLKRRYFNFFNNRYLNRNFEKQDYSSFLLNYPYNDVNMVKRRKYYKYSDIFPLKEITFEGISFLAPNKPDVYLTKLYENYKSLPPKNKRKPFHSKFKTIDSIDSEINKKYIQYKYKYFYNSKRKVFKVKTLFLQFLSNGPVDTYYSTIKPFIKRGFRFK